MTIIPDTATIDTHAAQAGDSTFVRVTKGKHVSEREFSKWFGKNYLGFGSRIEPGLGGDIGNPDWVIQPECIPGLAAVELKIGHVKGGTLYIDEVQPSQCSWHHRLHVRGGISVILTHTPDGVWATDGLYLNQWEDGYSISGGESDGAYQLNTKDPQSFSASLESFIDDLVMS